MGTAKEGIGHAELPMALPQPARRTFRKSKVTLYVCYLVLVLTVTLTWISWDLFDLESLDSKIRYNQDGACSGYDGVLHIAQGDVEGAAGTIFFLFVMNQLLYAEKHNLIPFIHLNDVSKYVYDPIVHGSAPSSSATIARGVNASWVNFVDPITKNRFSYAGRPVQIQKALSQELYTVHGTGVWNNYFEPVSGFSFNDKSCTSLPLIGLTEKQIIPALHLFCPWSLRAWRYGGLPDGLRRDDLSYQDWFAPMRKRGFQLIQKYVHVKPYLNDMVDKAMSRQDAQKRCLALHIRHSDKANRRKRIPVKSFLPFVQVYFTEHLGAMPSQNSFAPYIYLATDSHHVIQEIQSTWPANIVAHMHWQTAVVRSNDTTPVFTLTSSHHETNLQVLVDILGMSQCQHMLHGLSAVSEASHYFNPALHNQSINLEVLQRKQQKSQVEVFRAIVRGLIVKDN